ncbi:BREX-1 system adenine-specific DNA-methyltransferase PglX [Clostridium sp. AM46-21]|uniref:BREX-1 system adenine-specific DNA-methyltransferase PglX n=1 Tax=Clostridium sp. AM46-21 TaxID=2293033 RepID=UPI001FAA69F7|nr:BREX-1 system adenine-specific DNA-methyltransferase PglX [Clostridium sp. AM46-21]
MLYILGLMNTSIVSNMLLVLSPTLDYHEGPMSRVPIIISNQYKNRVEKIVKENIEMCKEDWDSFEISWDFKQHPLVKYSVRTIKEAFDIWTRECDVRYISLKNNEEELNKIFTDIYGLNGEVSVEVDEKDISVHRADLQREIKGLISYAVGCMFGRYSVNEGGLTQIGKTILNDDCFIDKDNCIPITDEEYFLDDIVGKFCEWLKLVYGEDTLEDNLKYIANALGNKGKTGREIIREYFVTDFIKDHIKMYQKRPIYWLFDSGKQNGFKALIYMHRYDADTVGRVRTDYLHKAQKYVETAMQSAQYTIDNATTSSEKSKATKAVTKYTKQLAEMKIYDEAIAHVANQRIEIDLDDGVKVNYAKFQGVEVAQEGKKALKVDLLAKI